jgi:hypothetical protein
MSVSVRFISYHIVMFFLVPSGQFSTLTSPNSAAEMVTYMPIASPFVRLAGAWVDDAGSFAMGWNYFFLMGKLHLIPRPLFGPRDPAQFSFSDLISVYRSLRRPL